MHAFALPGLNQMPCEDDTSTPDLIIPHRCRLVVCFQLGEHNVGCWGFCCCVGHGFFYFAPPSPLLWVTHPHPPLKRQEEVGDRPGRFLEGKG